MNTRTLALRISGTLFGLVALIHLFRLVTRVSVLIGTWYLPVWINWMGMFAAAFLCIWLWKLSMDDR